MKKWDDGEEEEEEVEEEKKQKQNTIKYNRASDFLRIFLH